MLCFLLPLLTTAQAETIYQELIWGGVSVDAAGVSTPYDGSDAWYESESDLVVQIPASGTVEHVYAIVMAKASGFLDDYDEAVSIHGVTLSEASLIYETELVAVFELDADDFGITGSAYYGYAETGFAESDWQIGRGISGTSLVVVYSDTSGPQRHVTVEVDQLYGSTAFNIEGLPADLHEASTVISLGAAWECSTEQSTEVYVDGAPLSAHAGGRDDGPLTDTYCGAQDWNSLITQGSFGVDNDGEVVGIDGDEPDYEPAGSSATDSRYSDELWSFFYSGDGDLELAMEDTSADGWFLSTVLMMEVAEGDTDTDTDADTGTDTGDLVRTPPDASTDEPITGEEDKLSANNCGCATNQTTTFGWLLPLFVFASRRRQPPQQRKRTQSS